MIRETEPEPEPKFSIRTATIHIVIITLIVKNIDHDGEIED